MRYWVVLYSTVLFFLSNAASSSPITTNAPIPSTDQTKEYPFSFKPFKKKNVFLEVTPLYALMTDNGMTTTSYAETLSTSSPSNYDAYVPGSALNWGYEVLLGYKFDPDALRYAAIVYTSVATTANNSVNAGASGGLFNDLTQLGTPGVDNGSGFTTMYGASTAQASARLQYDDLSLFVGRPNSDDGGTKIRFTKTLGIKALHMKKSLVADYSGLVPVFAGAGALTPAQDYFNYSSEYYGIGGEGGFNGHYSFFEKLNIRGGFSGALLAGYYHSSLSEEASAGQPVSIDTLTGSTSYNVSEQHKTQAWTPFIVKANAALEWTWIKNKKTGFAFRTEGGVATVYVLPTFTDDSYTPRLGTDLFRFNNSLNLVYGYVTFKMDLD